MNQTRYQPSPLADIDARREDDRWTLVFVRELRHPPERVWRALTDPAELRRWAPFDADRDLGETGEVTLTQAGGATREELRSAVRRAESPTLLEYSWGSDLLRWELAPSQSGTRLTLYHTLDDRSWLPKIAAGWHICLDVAEHAMAGQPIGRIVADEAQHHGWERLNDAYAARLGIASTGWPEGAARAPASASPKPG
jgi:uncharacterized protein YndB with AHSA1/START domain